MSSSENDRYNLRLVESRESREEVDHINKQFYERYNYPWPPISFELFTDPAWAPRMLNQDIGDWQNQRIPGNLKIWVAGCGTNQAVYTALRFPGAEVLGTDISTRSLDICRESANQIGIKNLCLEEKSIHLCEYKEEFDLVICTGVIHHNASPQAALNRLALSMKPDGVLELMVYNYCHRFLPTAFQKAVRTLYGKKNSKEKKMKAHLEEEFSIAKKLVNRFPVQNVMAEFLAGYRDSPEAKLADALFQPVEYSYTVESLEELAANCNLEFLLPCLNQFDKTNERYNWNMAFDDPEIDDCYQSLPDTARWQVSNLLMFNESPMLWFYLQSKDSGYKRKTEKEVCREFLETKFEKNTTFIKKYYRNKEGKYILEPRSIKYPSRFVFSDEPSRRIFNSVNPELTMKELFRNLKIDTTFPTINLVRINLTTTAFPYLQAHRLKSSL